MAYPFVAMIVRPDFGTVVLAYSFVAKIIRPEHITYEATAVALLVWFTIAFVTVPLTTTKIYLGTFVVFTLAQ